jgi:flagellin
MVINTNVASLTAQRHLAASRADMEQAMERLSSGKRINSAMDDAAGLTIAHSLDSKIASLSQAVRNANDGIALVNLAEGALDEVSVMLTRMKELATQAANGTYTATDLDALDLEYQALEAGIDDIIEKTDFNGTSLLNSAGGTIVFQVGDTSTDTVTLTQSDMDIDALGTTAVLNTTDLQDATNAGTALGILDEAIAEVDTFRATLGSVANRMEHAANNLMSRVEHQSAARSRIQDADYAVESANLAKAQVLQQAGTAMLAQANASTANILSLLK